MKVSRTVIWCKIRLLLGSFIVMLLVAPADLAAAAPKLRLDPAQGPCLEVNPLLTARGSGFEPGMALQMFVRRASDSLMLPRPLVGTAQVAADGTFTTTIQLFGCAPVIPSGTQYVINVQQDGVFMNDLALATFTVTGGPTPSASPSSMPGLPNTGAGGSAQPGGPIILLAIVALALISAGGLLTRAMRQTRS